MDELTAGDVDPGEREATEAPEAGRKSRRRSIFRRVTKAEAEGKPRKHRVVLAQNIFGRATEEIEVEDKTAAAHWDVRLWRRLR